jgi:hypothetical protein
MSTLKSNAEDLVLNADGASSSVKLQINGVEKASLTSAGFSGDGSGLTNLPVATSTTFGGIKISESAGVLTITTS